MRGKLFTTGYTGFTANNVKDKVVEGSKGSLNSENKMR